MASSYSLDIRGRVFALVDGGHSRRAATRHFAVSESFAAGEAGHDMGLEQHAAFLIGMVEGQPDITMPELAARLRDTHGLEAAPAMLSMAMPTRLHV